MWAKRIYLRPSYHTGLDWNAMDAGYLVRVIWKVRYPAMKEARRVNDCFPEPPTPTSSAWPRGVRMIREILIRWRIASSKNIRSIPAPRTLSLYWPRNSCSLSRSWLKDSICQRPCNQLTLLRSILNTSILISILITVRVFWINL